MQNCSIPITHPPFPGPTNGSTVALNDLSDVDVSSPSTNDVVQYDGSGWVAGPVPSHTHDDRYYTEAEINTFLGGKADTAHTHALDDLSDVDTTGVADGDVLTFDLGTSTWIAVTPSGGGATTFDALTDTDTTGLVAGDSIKWDGANWVPYTLTDDYYTSTEVDEAIADSLREHIINLWWNVIGIGGVGTDSNGSGTGTTAPDNYGLRFSCTGVDAMEALSVEMLAASWVTGMRWSCICRPDPESAGWTVGQALIALTDNMHLTHFDGTTGVDRQADHAGLFIDATQGDIFSDPYLQASSGTTGLVQSTDIKVLSGWGGAREDELIGCDIVLGVSCHFYDAATGTLVATHTTAVPTTLSRQEAVVCSMDAAQNINFAVRSTHLRYALV